MIKETIEQMIGPENEVSMLTGMCTYVQYFWSSVTRIC